MKKLIGFATLLFFLAAALVSVTLASSEEGGNYPLFRVSVGTGDVEGNGSSFHAYSNYDARYVAFESYARNWAYDGPGGMINYADIFVRDLQSGTTTKLTTGLVGGTGNNKSFFPSVSSDGRFIAYLSYASNLVPNDTNGEEEWVVDGLDMFVYDQMFGSTTRVSLNYAGQEIMGNSEGIITGDGNLVIFASDGSNVMPDSTPARPTHIYVRNWLTGEFQRITQTINGQEPDGVFHQITASSDGRLIAYASDVDNIVPNDFNNSQDIFLYNRETGTTTLISKGLSGFSANASSGRPQISPGGEYLAFSSFASDLVQGDTNGFEDVFLYEISTGNMRRLSVTSGGQEANGDNKEPTICDNGRYIAWTSGANNYTPLDINLFRDVYFYDTFQNQLRLVSVDMNGYSPNGPAHRAWLSSDCRWIIFASDSDNMINGDTNESRDLFMQRLLWPFNLSTSNQSGPAYAEAGETLTYRVLVRNHGLETRNASFFTSPVPENTTFVSGSGTNGAVYNSSLNRVEWSGLVMAESEIPVEFKVLVSPGLTETTFLRLDTQLSGDSVGYSFESVTIVNGFHAMLPAFSKQ